jgi:hypothetical protein
MVALNAHATMAQLNNTSVLMDISLKVDRVIEMSFWGVFWSSFMQNVCAWLMMLGECSTRCHLKKCD